MQVVFKVLQIIALSLLIRVIVQIRVELADFPSAATRRAIISGVAVSFRRFGFSSTDSSGTFIRPKDRERKPQAQPSRRSLASSFLPALSCGLRRGSATLPLQT